MTTEPDIPHAYLAPIDDLSRFNNPEELRNYLTEPVPQNGYTLHCDNNVLIAIPADASEIADKEPIADVWREAVARAAMPNIRVVLRAVMPPSVDACPLCDGRGTITEYECNDCEDGRFEHGGHWYDCESCGGSGKYNAREDGSPTRCPKCYGSRVYSYRNGLAAVGGLNQSVSLMYAALLVQQFPDIEIEPIADAKGRFYFRSPSCGMVGAVMGCRVQELV